MPIRIAYIIDHLPRGGTEIQLAELIQRIDRRKFEPFLIMLRDMQETSLHRKLDCRSLILNVDHARDILFTRGLWDLSSYLKKNRIRIIQTFFPDATLVGVLGARMASVPCIIISRRDIGTWHRRNDRMKFRITNKLAHHWIVNSHAVRQYLIHSEYVADADIKVIPNGIDHETFRRETPDKPVRTIGVISNFNRYVKRLDVFLRAMEIIARKYESIRFLIIGNVELKHWDAEISEDILDRFVFTGLTSNIHEYLPEIDIGINCSDSEGFSNVILEYMASSIPCVCTDCDGNREIVQDGCNGFLFPPGDPESLAAKVSLLIEDGNLRKRFIQASLDRMKDTFDWSRVVKEHEKYYLGLAESRE